jgi:uncharacterized membrane protein
MEKNARRIIQTALFITLSVVLGFLLAGVPNIELMTVTVFLSGIILGSGRGMLVGALSILIYSIFNPYGPPPPQLLAAQVAGYVLAGLLGGLLRGPLMKKGKKAVLLSALSGSVVTILYDIVTTAATALIALGPGGFFRGLVGFFLTGAPFVVVHVLSNTAVFSLAVVPVLKAVASFEGSRVE